MDSVFLTNLTTPPLLFFILGALAALFRSDLDIPEQIAKFLSLYLLFAIGFKGGVALSTSAFDLSVVAVLLVAIVLAALVPFGVYFLLKRRFSVADAAATAATYGSISAVTFVTCTSYLDAQDIPWSGYLVAAMALMESPAIIVGLMLYRMHAETTTVDSSGAIGVRMMPMDVVKESFLNGSVFLILGSLVIGWITGPEGKTQIAPFIDELFIGILCLFLLDMGIVAMRRMKDMQGQGTSLAPRSMVLWGLVIPLGNALLAIASAWLLNLGEGDALLLIVLCASASYIAVPAAMRLALPQANPSTYLAMSLAITFPFNLIIGIPLYHMGVRMFLI
ncbi:MAG: sodium-dependent bicarbonate transport family permease [Pseudomonadota bacterium]